MNEIVVGIDIGSSKVCTVLGEINRSNQVQILGVGLADCRGIKKGVITDIDSAVEAIKNSIAQAQRMSNMEIRSAFINISGGHVSLIKNRGVIAVSGDDREITYEDVDRVIRDVRAVNVPVDREIIGVVPVQYIVDGYEHIKDPVGMVGSRLEVEAYIITAITATVQNLIRSVQRAGINVLGMIVDSLASAQVLLTREEKELQVALIDVGSERTEVSVFKGDNLLHISVIPVGGVHITNDISIGLKIPISEAEILKRQYGYAAVSMLTSIEDIPINGLGGGRVRKVTNKDLVDIIEARVQEIYYLIDKQLKDSGYKDSIAGGVVVTGGGLSFIRGSADVGTSIIGLPIRIGVPSYVGVASPIYSVGAGMVKYILSSQKNNSTEDSHIDDDSDDTIAVHRYKSYSSQKSQKFIERVKKFLLDFF